jgi:GNAT superfamily N-acetyltransferase
VTVTHGGRIGVVIDEHDTSHLIRDASDADGPEIWSFLRVIVRAGDTYTWSPDLTEDEAHSRWFLPRPWRVFVAVASQGGIAGTAKVGPNQDGPGAHVANASFMVNPDHAGSGVGQALGQHVLRFARDEGYRAMQFNAVVETNSRAVALWRSLGFDILTTIPEAFRHPTSGYVGLHVMYRRL